MAKWSWFIVSKPLTRPSTSPAKKRGLDLAIARPVLAALPIEIFIRNRRVRVKALTRKCLKTVLRMSFKSTGYAKAKTVSRGDLRDDRPPHGRGGRASKDGLAASRRANGMANL
jgi:hypothetical protein